jgi:hypothetical protein
MNGFRLAVAGLLCVSGFGCAASQKTFYAAPKKVNDTTLCRTFLEASKNGNKKFAQDTANEAIRRGLTLERCKTKVDTENAVLLTAALVTTAVGVGVACRDGCGGGYTPAPQYATSYVDYDCAGGGGNGPYYVQGPFRMTGPDIYALDADHDGIGCELGEGGWGT